MPAWWIRFLTSRSQDLRPHLLFVCTANRCRSPMAEGICRARVRESRLDWKVSSAGFFVDSSMPPAEGTLRVLKKHGIRTDGMVSQRLSAELLRSATDVFVTEAMHLVSLRKQFPKLKASAHLLSDFAANPELHGSDVPDPAGKDLAAYEQLFHLLNELMPRLLSSIAATRS